MLFQDRVAIVTGAGRGIGREHAMLLASEGASVVVNDLGGGTDGSGSDAGPAAAVAAEIRDAGGAAVANTDDVSDWDGAARLIAQATDEFGRLDVLINNAGTITISKLEDLTLEAWNRVLAVNTTGAFLCAKAVVPLMRRAGKGGRILNAASGQARQGFIYTPHYAASKFGVVGLTQSLAKELAAHQITVNAYCPGIVGTDMWDYNDREWGRLLGTYGPGELMAEWVAGIPLGRAGTNDDVANLLLFLASDEASYITGQSINVDGGMFMS
jgi:meso-butanediol dehydrogenase / (S,S)-butanediol dehydrogenase / diacetyl reductase